MDTDVAKWYLFVFNNEGLKNYLFYFWLSWVFVAAWTSF